MKIRSTSIKGVCVVETELIEDPRGMFYRAFCDTQLDQIMGARIIRQASLSRTNAVGAIRGLHFQYPPHAEMKLVRCLRGRVWDVALDLRKGSPTFLKWHAEELSRDNACMMIIPEGCAHGFQVLSPDSELLYLHTAPYEPGSEGAVGYNDPMANISWPLAVTDISRHDTSCRLLDREFGGIEL
jgi:dTDP-4-dehydrorhamnose 3,5-epimerase